MLVFMCGEIALCVQKQVKQGQHQYFTEIPAFLPKLAA